MTPTSDELQTIPPPPFPNVCVPHSYPPINSPDVQTLPFFLLKRITILVDTSVVNYFFLLPFFNPLPLQPTLLPPLQKIDPLHYIAPRTNVKPSDLLAISPLPLPLRTLGIIPQQ